MKMSRVGVTLLAVLTGGAWLLAAETPSAGGLPPDLQKVVETVRQLEKRVETLEEELAEARLQMRQSAATSGGGGAQRPLVEDEEPFDSAKLKASDPAEAEAVAEAVAALLPSAVKRALQEQAQTPATPRPAAALSTASSPKILRRIEPVIPASLRNSITSEVNVAVKVYVSANGEVIGTMPVKQGDPVADQLGVLAADAVTRWSFEPVLQNGLPSAGQTIVRMKFTK